MVAPPPGGHREAGSATPSSPAGVDLPAHRRSQRQAAIVRRETLGAWCGARDHTDPCGGAASKIRVHQIRPASWPPPGPDTNHGCSASREVSLSDPVGPSGRPSAPGSDTLVRASGTRPNRFSHASRTSPVCRARRHDSHRAGGRPRRYERSIVLSIRLPNSCKQAMKRSPEACPSNVAAQSGARVRVRSGSSRPGNGYLTASRCCLRSAAAR